MKTLYNFIIIIIFITVITIIIGNPSVLAQTKTPTPTPGQSPSGTAPSPTPEITSEEKEQDTIEKIKNLVASRAAELKLVDKRGILGVVKRSSSSQIVIEDHKRDQRTIDIDELTKFISSKDSFGISDIKEGDKISAMGFYNKDTRRLRASFISLSANIPLNIEAVVNSRNSREFTLTVVDTNGKTRTIDIGTSTKTSTWADNSLTKSGFSKILIGQRILVIGFEDLKNKDTINASRIIHFADLPLSGALKKYQNVQEETPTSTGSGVNVKPLKP